MSATINASTTSGLVMSSDLSGSLQLQTNSGTTALTIDTSQNVGIGTSTPDIFTSGNKVLGLYNGSGVAQMQISGSTAARIDFGLGTTRYGLIYQDSTNFMQIGTLTALPINFSTNNTERMRITSGGSVLIGQTTAPSSGTGLTTNGVQYNYSTSGGGLIQTPNGTGLSFYTYTGVMGSETYTERMRIDSSGNLLVGTTSTQASSKFLVSIIPGTTTGYATLPTTATGYTAATFLNSVAAGIGSITTTTVATLFNTTSDYRLKTVIGNVTNSGQRIDALEPIEYDWNEGGRTRGFLAHKFAEIYPNSVTGEKDAIDKDGKPVYQGMQASTPEVMADLIAEIQSLRKRVAQLESK